MVIIASEKVLNLQGRSETDCDVFLRKGSNHADGVKTTGTSNYELF
jgi:hypothetical protein